MIEYHKIQTVFKRNPETKFKTLLIGEYSMPEFEYLKNNIWVFTEKIDGTNIRIMWDGKDIKYGGKTDDAQIPVFLFDKLNVLFNDKKELFLELFKDSKVYLYGEGYGAKIQKGGGNYIKDGVDFILFDIKIDEWWLKREDIEKIAKKLKLKIVPILGEDNLNNMIGIVECGFNSYWGNFIAEGIVARPKIELKTRSGQRIITKLKHKDFIIKKSDEVKK